MKKQATTKTATTRNNNHSQRGVTMLEALISISVIVVLAGVIIPQVYNEFQKARVNACKAEVDLMKAVAYDIGDGRYIPTPEEFWGEGFPDADEGEYYYIVDSEDHNKGHGNDLDNCDEDNPGASIENRTCLSLKFVVFCAHDHGEIAKYVYATDQQAPTVVPVDGVDPFDFLAQKDQPQGEDPKPVGKKPKKTK